MKLINGPACYETLLKWLSDNIIRRCTGGHFCSSSHAHDTDYKQSLVLLRDSKASGPRERARKMPSLRASCFLARGIFRARSCNSLSLLPLRKIRECWQPSLYMMNIKSLSRSLHGRFYSERICTRKDRTKSKCAERSA